MNNSRTKNSLLNMGASIGYQLANLVLSFVSRTIFLQVLGVEYLGINGLFNDVLSMLNMADLGFSTAMTFSMYKPLAEGDEDTLAGLTHFYKKVYRIIALTIATIGVALIPFLPYLVNLEKDIPHVELYYLLFLAGNIASYLVTYKTVVLYADQKNYIMLGYGIYWQIARTMTMLLTLWLTKNYTLYLIVQILYVYAQNFFMSRLASKHYPYLSKKVTLSKEKTNGIFKDVGSAFLYKIANVLINATDNTLISVLVSTEMVGYYSNYQISFSKLGAIVSTIFSSTIASLGNFMAKENAEKRLKLFQTMQSMCLIFSGFFATCVISLEEDFIRVWLGADYVLDKLTLVAAVLNFYLSISLTPIITFREAAGLFRKTKSVMLCTAALNLAFSIVLGKMTGLSGILFATVLSKLLTYFWYEPKLLFREYFKESCGAYFLGMLKNACITLLSICLVSVCIGWITPTGWFQLIGKGILVACVSMVVFALNYYKTEGFKLLTARVKNVASSVIGMLRKLLGKGDGA